MKTKKFILVILSGLLTFLPFIVQAQPTWSVDPHQYMYSMTITGKIYSDGSFSADVNDMVGAFINNECRGVATVKYIQSVNDYFVFLMVYSNSPVDNITFRIFDKSLNQDMPAKETAAFLANGSLGTSGSPFVFTASNLSNLAQILTFTIPFQQGVTTITGSTVALEEDWRGNLKAIAPVFTLSAGAKAYVNGVLQISGVTLNDFINPVLYTVKSQDNTVTSVYTVSITTGNDIPTDILLSANTVNENQGGVLIGNLTAISPKMEDAHIYSLVGETENDNQYFKIIGDQLFSKVSFNFEEKSTYQIKVLADDQKGGKVTKVFTIAVVDKNDDPTNIQLTDIFTPLLAPAGFTIGRLTATDPDVNDAHTFSLQTGNGINNRDNWMFKIEGDKLKCRYEVTFNENTKFDILVKATDKGNASVIVPLSIVTQTDSYLNSQSKLLTFTINQQIGPTVFVGNDVYVVQKSDGNLALATATFSISPGAIVFVNYVQVTGSIIKADFSKPVSVIVEAFDKTMTSYWIYATVASNIPADILLTNTKTDENMGSTMIGKLSISPVITYETYEFSFVSESGNDNALFIIKGNELWTTGNFDFEVRSSYLVKIKAVNQKKAVVEKSFTITINDKNEAPSEIYLSNSTFDIGSSVNTLIGRLSTKDQDVIDKHTYSLVTGNGTNDDGNQLVKISGDSLLLAKQIINPVKFSWNILVRVTDKMNERFEKGMTLTARPNSNNPPVITSKSATYVTQNQIYFYTIETSDIDGDTISISFENLPGWITYYPALNLLSGSPANKDVGVHTFTIIASDKKSTATQKVTLMVANINDPPVISFYITNQVFLTNTDNQFVIPADCFTDPDVGDVVKLSVSLGNNSVLPAWLLFDQATGTLKGKPTHAAIGNYQIKVTATDLKMAAEWMIFNLEVTIPTAIDGFKTTDDLQVFPNPVKDYLHLKVPAVMGKTDVHISNMQGEIIRIFQIQQGGYDKIYLGNLPGGIYVISFQSEKTKVITKVLKK